MQKRVRDAESKLADARDSSAGFQGKAVQSASIIAKHVLKFAPSSDSTLGSILASMGTLITMLLQVKL